jgi:hypothetical protein
MTSTCSAPCQMLRNTALHRTGFSVTVLEHKAMFHSMLQRFTNYWNTRSLVSAFTEAIYNKFDICRPATAQLGPVPLHCCGLLRFLDRTVQLDKNTSRRVLSTQKTSARDEHPCPQRDSKQTFETTATSRYTHCYPILEFSVFDSFSYKTQEKCRSYKTNTVMSISPLKYCN